MTEEVRRSGVSPRTIVIAALVVVALVVLPGAYLWNQVNAPLEVQGVVLSVQTRPPLAVDSFELLAGDGRRLTFQIGQLDISNGFDAAHLVSHQLTLQPVIVSYRQDGDRLVAVHLADGPVGPVASGGSGAAAPVGGSGAASPGSSPASS